MNVRGKTLRGNFIHAPQASSVEALTNCLLGVDGSGRIAALYPVDHAEREPAENAARQAGNLVEFGDADFLVPGLIDLHVHAPQYPQLGLALDEPLEVWLEKYTFPLESRYADPEFARQCYSQLVDDLLRSGTTTAAYFGTVHQEATRILADICIEKGQRALVGKVAMDNPDSCPDDYRDRSAEESVSGTRALIDYIRGHPGNRENRVLPVVTPRFIPSCTDAALAGLGALAAECGCHIQTHCSESDWAHAHVLDRHGMTDAASLDRFRLLGRRTILAHATRLEEADWKRLCVRGSAIAHCPLSNAYFGDAVFPLRAALARGVHVGLGTDISGGPTASVLESARMAMAASRILQSGADPDRAPGDRNRPNSAIDFQTAFHLATSAGGTALDLPIGRFEVGYRFDALRIDAAAPDGTIRLFGTTDAISVLQKIVHTASRPNIADVWVDGVRV